MSPTLVANYSLCLPDKELLREKLGALAPIPKIIALRTMAVHSLRMLYKTLVGFCAA